MNTTIMNTLKKASIRLPRVSLFKPSSVRREFDLENFGLPSDLEDRVEELNDASIQATNKEFLDFPKFSKHCYSYTDVFNTFKNKKMYGDNHMYLEQPTSHSIVHINWDEVRKVKPLGVNTDDFISHMHSGWTDSNLQKYLRNIYETDVVPDWVNDTSTTYMPNSIKQYAWRTSRGNSFEPQKTYYDLFVTGPQLLYEFDTQTDSLNHYVWLQSLDQNAQIINNAVDDLERKCEWLHYRMGIDQNIKECGGLDNYISGLTNVEIVSVGFHDDQVGDRFLGAMIEAIDSIEGAEDFIANRYDTIYSRLTDADRNIMNAIQSYPEVDACGHSGTSVSWTLANAQSYYKNGPRKFLIKKLDLRFFPDLSMT